MALAKVIAFTTKISRYNRCLKMVATIGANTSPEAFIYQCGLTGCVDFYEVSEIMPLPMALEYAAEWRRAIGMTA